MRFDGRSADGLRLETIYKQHGGHIYSLCLRLLADQCRAEDATAEAFVRFHKEMESQLDGPQIFSRLRQLGIEAAVRRLRARGGRIGHFLCEARMKVSRLWQP